MEKKNKIYAIYHETVMHSIIADVFTFGCLSFCIWFSDGSKFWTFVCFVMFLLWMSAKSKMVSIKEFRSIKSLRDWSNSLDDDETEQEVI